MDQLQNHILKALLYFDIFKYPLKIEELARYIPGVFSQAAIDAAVAQLVMNKKIYQYQRDFVSIDEDEQKVLNRIDANALAEEKMQIAFKNGRLIGNFPFVRGVYLSGSLSKGVMKSDSDIDYFIITADHRLWLCRVMLVIYKRIVLLNSRMEFCINYFKSESKLEIEDQNMFTAVELATMIPVVSNGMHQKMMDSNRWMESMVNGFIHERANNITERAPGRLSRFLEWAFGGSLGNMLDKKCLQLVQRRNKKRYSAKLNDQNYKQMFRSNDHTAKVHPLDHQGLVLNKYEHKLNQFNLEPEIVLSNG